MTELTPKIPIYELNCIHQITQIISFPIYRATCKSLEGTKNFENIFVYLGPCQQFKEDTKLINPFVPVIYLVDSDGKACWVSSGDCDVKDIDSLEKFFHKKSKKK